MSYYFICLQYTIIVKEKHASLYCTSNFLYTQSLLPAFSPTIFYPHFLFYLFFLYFVLKSPKITTVAGSLDFRLHQVKWQTFVMFNFVYCKNLVCNHFYRIHAAMSAKQQTVQNCVQKCYQSFKLQDKSHEPTQDIFSL